VKLKLLSNLSSPITFSDENTQNSVHAPLQAKRRFAYPSTCEKRPFRGTEVAYEHGKWRRREDEEAMKRGRENGLAPVEIMKKSAPVVLSVCQSLSYTIISHWKVTLSLLF